MWNAKIQKVLTSLPSIAELYCLKDLKVYGIQVIYTWGGPFPKSIIEGSTSCPRSKHVKCSMVLISCCNGQNPDDHSIFSLINASGFTSLHFCRQRQIPPHDTWQSPTESKHLVLAILRRCWQTLNHSRIYHAICTFLMLTPVCDVLPMVAPFCNTAIFWISWL